jgi:hypothetical protein
MTAATAADCIGTNLELLREATRADTRLSHEPRHRVDTFAEIQVARGMLATGNPEQLRGQAWTCCPGCKSRLAPLRVSELRDTGKPRPIRPRMPARNGSPRDRLGAHHRLFHRRATGRLARHRRRVRPARTGKCSCTCS